MPRSNADELTGSGKHRHGRACRALTGLVLVAGLALAGTILVPPLLGYERYVITGGSMSGTYDRGSLLYERVVPVEDLRVGDVITYDPPRGKAPPGLVTHRIVSIHRAKDGTATYRTKGDANETADPWRFTLHEANQARAAFHIPYVGYAFSVLSDRELRMLLLGVPAVLIALAMVARLWRDAGEAVATRTAAGETPAEG